MACSIINDPRTGEIVQVLAPNGKPSILFKNALEITGNPQKALRAWAAAYTPRFKRKYGDWEKEAFNYGLDENGEPTVDLVMHTPSGIKNIVQTYFSRWYKFQPGVNDYVNEAEAKRFKAALKKKFPDLEVNLQYNYSMEGKAKVSIPTSIKQFEIKQTKKQLEDNKRLVNSIMDKLVVKFKTGEKKLTYKWIKPSDLVQSEHYEKVNNIRAFVRNGEIFLVEGRVMPEDGIEEVMHVFVEYLRQSRPTLFKGILDAASNDPKYQLQYIELENFYRGKMGKGVDVVIKSEFLAKTLAAAMRHELELNPDGRPASALGRLIERFLEWLANALGVGRLSGKETIQEIVAYLNTEDINIPMPGDNYLFYSTEPTEPYDYDPENRDDQEQFDPKKKYPSNKEKQLAKAKQELEKLAKIREFVVKNSGNPLAAESDLIEGKRLKQIDLLIQNVNEKIQALQDDVETVSVSNYMGSEQIESSKTKVAEIGASFGEFYHYLMEQLQDDYMTTNNAPIIIFSDPKWFDKFFEKNKSLIKFDNYDKEALRKIGNLLAAKLNTYVIDGKVLLPEIAIAAKDVDGKLVLGRLDIMSLDKDGNMSVIDLKTKKAGILDTGLEMNRFPEVFFTQRPASLNAVTFKPGVVREFSNIRQRSALKKYQIQLAVYSEMLVAIGISPENINEREIIAIAYNLQETAPGSEVYTFINYAVGTFNRDYFRKMDPSGEVDMAAKVRFRPGATAEEIEEAETRARKDNPFANMDINLLTEMVNRLQDVIKNQLDKLKEEEINLNKNENISFQDKEDAKSAIVKRRAQLLEVGTRINEETVTGKTDEQVRLSKAMIIVAAIQVFENEIAAIRDKVGKIDIPETYELRNIQNQNMLKTLQAYAFAVENIKSYISAFKNTVTNIENLDDKVRDELNVKLDDVINQSNKVASIYAKVGRKIIKTIIMETVGPDNADPNKYSKFSKVFGDMRKMLGPKLRNIEKTIAELEGNQVSVNTIAARISRGIANLLTTNKKTSLEKLKEEAERIRKIMQINELNDKTLDDYLDAMVNNKDSGWYMGSTIDTSMDGIVNIDQLIGQNANSEMVISAVWQYLRDVTESARVSSINWMAETDVNKVTGDFIQHMGGDLYAANAAVSEEVDIAIAFNEAGEPTEFKKMRTVLAPIAVAYFNEFNKFKYLINKLRDEIQAKNKQKAEASEADKQAIQLEVDALYAKHSDLERDFTEWQIKYSRTRYKAEVMRLFLGSGTANAEIADLYKQINDIVTRAHGIQNITEEQQEAIDNLEAKISRIRQQLIDKDPALKEKLDQLLEYFQYDLNYGLWTKKKVEIEAQGNPTALARWHENNSVLAPTDAFRDRVDAIWEEIGRVSEEDPVLKDLFAQRAAIRNRNKVRGKFNILHMTEEDINEYMEIEKRIEDRKDATRDPLSPTSDYIKQKFAELGSIQKDDLSPIYVKKREQLIKEVKRAHKEYRDYKEAVDKAPSGTATKAMEDLMLQAFDQYLRKEEDFATFFNKYNTTTYELGQDIIVENKDLREAPKRFVFIKVPTDPKDMALIPNTKYRIKRLKEEAYNTEDYQDSFQPFQGGIGSGFYPMPKAISFNKQTNEFEIDRSKDQTYVNSKFVDMQRDPVKLAFYNQWFIKNFLLKQKDASGRPLGFFAPFVQQKGLENLISKGAEGITREVKEKLQELQYSTSKIEEATNESGISGKEKIYFPQNQAVTADLTTTDVIGAIVNWNVGYFLNKALTISAAETEAVIAFLEFQKSQVSGENEKKFDVIIKEITYSHKKFNYGQMYEKGTSNHPILNRKTMRVIMQMAAFGRMAFDLPMQFGNMLSGNVQTYLSTQESRFASSDDYLKAKKSLYTRFFPKMLADYGKQSGMSLETMIYYYMNPTLKDLEGLVTLNTAKKMRRVANRVFSFGDIGMMLQDKGEIEVGMTTMLMILHNRKFEQFEINPDGSVVIEDGIKKVKKDADGNTIYVDGTEVFELKNGAIKLRDDVNITEKEMSRIKGTIMTEIYRFQGNYAKATKSSFSGTAIGSLFNFYRNYLIPALSARFSSGGFEGVGSAYSWDAAEAYTGYYVALMKMFKYYGLGKAGKALLYDTFLPGFVKKNIKFEAEEDMDYYRGRAAMAAREMLMALLFYMLYQALRTMIMDDDDEDLNYIELSLFRSLVKVSNESRSMVPLPVIGKPGDYIDNFSQLTSAFKEGKTIWDLSENSFWALDYAVTGSEFAYERGFYQRDTDRWMEGDPKLYKNVSDLFAVSNIVDVIKPREAAERAVKMK